MSEESRHRMFESEKPFSTDMVKLRVGSDFNRSILVHELVAVFLLFIFESSLVFVLKTPKMFMQIHGYLSGSICSSSAN